MFIKKHIHFFLIILFSVSYANLSCSEEVKSSAKSPETENPSLISKIHRLESIKITELLLNNGMTVCLKSTDSETDEVFFKLAALGGFASLPQNFFLLVNLLIRLLGNLVWEG